MSYRKTGNSAHLKACALLVGTTLAACGGGGGGGGSPADLAAALPDGDHILFSVLASNVSEAQRTGSVSVIRTGDATDAVSVNFRFNDGSAIQGDDYSATSGVLNWAAGETGAKAINFTLLADVQVETQETFEIELFDLAGVETISGSAIIDVTLDDSVCQSVSGEITGDTQWTASCYHITDSVVVSAQSQLEINAGATIIAAPDTGISITQNATIDVQGTQSAPVNFKGASANAGSWNGIAIISNNPLQQINYTNLDGANVGVDMGAGAQLGSFSNNTISNTALAALRMPTDALSALGDDIQFENNPGGVRLLTETITASSPLTLNAISTHYSSGTSLIVDGPLVLEPGVEIRFATDTQIYVSSNGSLNAVGTADDPIVLTGTESVSGHWNGIQWVSSTSTSNRLMHVTVSYAGGDPARAGNLVIAGSDTSLLVTDSTITNSAGYGVYQIGAGSDVVLENVSYESNALGDHSIR